jgi:hypothetical protein
MQKGTLVVYEYGHTPGYAPYRALAIIDDVRAEGTQNEIVLVKPVFWTQGSPLSKWLWPGSKHIVAVLNAPVPKEIEKASA